MSASSAVLLSDALTRESRLWGPAEPGRGLARAETLLASACRGRPGSAAAAARAARLAGLAMRRRPWSWRATAVLAAARSLRAENFLARRAVERARRALGGRPELLLLSARLSWKADPEAALRLLDAVLAAAPGFGPAHAFRGELLRRLGRTEEALAALTRGITLDPCDPRPLLWRASALAGRAPERARAELDGLARGWPSPRVFAERGRLRERGGDARGAVSDYSRALRLLGERPELSEAIDTLESAKELGAWLLHRRFACRAAAGALDSALADLSAAHAADPKYAWGRRSREGDGAAEGLLEDALARRPRSARLLAWSGREALDCGAAAEAEARLSKALALDARGPSSTERGEGISTSYRSVAAWAGAWRAEARLRLGRIEEARADAREALSRAPGYAPLWGTIAEIELRLGRYRAAVASARRAVRLYHCSAWGYALLGEALLGCGRREAAKRALDSAVALDPAAVRPRALLRAAKAAA